MGQVTIFGGREGTLRYDGTIYLTLFGSCTMMKPTLARQIMIARQQQLDDPGSPQNPNHRDMWSTMSLAMRRNGRRRTSFFMTIFGATSIKNPTLAEELVDLQELLRSGELSLADWDRAMLSLSRLDRSCASFTMFGGFDEAELPTEEEEVNSLAMQCHLGNINDSSREVLQAGIGLSDSERRAVLHRAVEVTA